MPAPARQLDLELIDDEKVVVRPVFEIDVLDRLRPTLIPIRQAISYRALEQQFRRGLIDLHESVAGSLLEVPNSPRDALIVQPRLAGAQVELAQRGHQAPFEQGFARTGAFSGLGQVRISLNPLPAHQFELFAEGLFTQVVFPLDLHRKAYSSIAFFA